MFTEIFVVRFALPAFLVTEYRSRSVYLVWISHMQSDVTSKFI
jgi:hypothetical protein